MQPGAAPMPVGTTLRGAGGGLLHVRRWSPDAAPVATVVIVHGFAEHGGRYAAVAERLVAEGYVVVAADQRGHGMSSGKRRSIRHWQEYVDDLHIVMQDITVDEGIVPAVMIGHSMGGLVALT